MNPDATLHVQIPVKKRVVKFVRDLFGVSLRRACTTLGFHRSTQRYESRKDDADLEGKLQRLATETPSKLPLDQYPVVGPLLGQREAKAFQNDVFGGRSGAMVSMDQGTVLL